MERLEFELLSSIAECRILSLRKETFGFSDEELVEGLLPLQDDKKTAVSSKISVFDIFFIVWSTRRGSNPCN